MLNTPINRKTTCSKCNGDLLDRFPKYRYCRSCNAEYIRVNGPKHSELSPTAKLKTQARARARIAVKYGHIQKENCVECGSGNAQMHHEDYQKPLDVVWLCRSCHFKHHKIHGYA